MLVISGKKNDGRPCDGGPRDPGGVTGFTAEERAAMKERAKELKAAADEADAERAVLAKIAEMPKPDRVLGERFHAIVTASAPELSPRLWYGMPAYTKEGKVV